MLQRTIIVCEKRCGFALHTNMITSFLGSLMETEEYSAINNDQRKIHNKMGNERNDSLFTEIFVAQILVFSVHSELEQRLVVSSNLLHDFLLDTS